VMSAPLRHPSAPIENGPARFEEHNGARAGRWRSWQPSSVASRHRCATTPVNMATWQVRSGQPVRLSLRPLHQHLASTRATAIRETAGAAGRCPQS
jgi:hypothetical protein